MAVLQVEVLLRTSSPLLLAAATPNQHCATFYYKSQSSGTVCKKRITWP